jgi:serine/threonine protein kinase
VSERPFGPYQLVRQIAVGGMAEIHLAKTRGLAGFEKFVALKMIHPNFAQDDQFIEMLIDEAKIAVQLQHVNIAHTFDLGRVGETYYIVMEFVDGADLYQILRKGSERELDMPVDVAAFIAKEMANGLDYAHRKRDPGGQPMGIVHRDVSPQNVLVSTAGEVKLVDFGIAKATMKARQTAVGVIKGKYYYMSPEQAWGERIDHRSDIFSTGIVLYEMLTSQMLYLEEDIPRLLEMARKADIAPVRTVRKDVPPQLERIVMRALAKRAGDRYQSAGDLATDLERFLHTYSPVFSPAKLAGHVEVALGQEPEAPVITVEPAPTGPTKRSRRDSGIARNTLITQRSEFSDENSVIFRVAELQQQGQQQGRQAATAAPAAAAPGGRPGQRRAPSAPPDPQAARASPRMITASTLPLADDGEVESTLVSAQPEEGPTAFDGPRGLRKTKPAELLGDDYEPTVVEAAPTDESNDATAPDGNPFDDDGGPTQTREPYRPAAAARGGRAEPPAALAARTPTPAVSELRKPRESRRTPAGGVPAARPPAPPPPPPASVLRAIVGDGQAPMPRPARGAGAPLSDGVPSTVSDGALSTGSTGAAGGRGGVPGRRPPPVASGFDARTEPGALAPGHGPPGLPVEVPAPPGLPAAVLAPASPSVAPPPAMHTPAGMPAYPQVPHPQAFPTGLPAHLMPYAYGQGEAAPGLPPGAPGYPPGYPPGYAPPGYGSSPPTISAQLRALEVDELPPQYKLDSGRSWLWRGLLAAFLVIVGVVAAVIVIGRGDEPPPTASIVIDSKPGGATVTIDGAPVPDRTPLAWKTKPGARHEIVVTLPGYQAYRDTVLVPEGGGEVKVLAFLPARTVRLRIVSTPAGADVYVGGSLRGRTPLELPELDPATATEVEVRLKDYAPQRKPVTWTDEQREQTVDFRMAR